MGKNYYTRLHLRHHTYYIRVGVPKALKALEKITGMIVSFESLLPDVVYRNLESIYE